MTYEEQKKYAAAGIYSISIDNSLVYIGKSHNMLRRIQEHMAAIQCPTSHKYRILNEALHKGHNIKFDVLYYAKAANPYTELFKVEAYYINKYLPPLNYQIPDKKNYRKYTIQETAATISLDEII